MYLGTVQYVSPDRRFAKVRPAFERRGEHWVDISGDEVRFPPNGVVYWFQPHQWANDNSLVTFEITDNVSTKPGAERFKVANAETLTEFLDVRKRGGLEALRIALCGPGLPYDLPTGRYLLWADDTHVIGPLRLTRRVAGGVAFEEADKARVPWFALSRVPMVRLSVRGTARAFVEDGPAGQPDGYLDWDHDKLVLRRALEYAAKATEAGKQLSLTTALLTDAASVIAGIGSGPEEQLQTYRVKRAIALLPKDEVLRTAVDELSQAILGLPTAKLVLDAAAKQARDSAEQEVRGQLAAESAALLSVRKERQEVEQALAAARSSLSDATKSRERSVEELERVLSERTRAAVEQPAKLLAEAALLKPLIGNPQPPRAMARAIHPAWQCGAVLPDASGLRRELATSFSAAGLSGALGLKLHGAFSAGLVPVVSGPAAVDGLEAYASVTARGRLTVVEIRPEVAEVRDLFGVFEAGRGRFVPHASGLLEVVLAAQQSSGLALVVLEGVNRAATEAFLPQLARLVASRARDLTLFPAVAAVAEEPYLAHSVVRWPSNLLVAATLTEGAATLPVSPQTWAASVHLRAGIEHSLAAVPTGAPREPTEIATGSALFPMSDSRYDELVREFAHAVESFPDQAASYLRAIISAPLQSYARGLGAVVDEANARTALVHGCLLPVITSLKADAEREQCLNACKTLVKSAAELGRSFEEIRRALG